MALFHGVPILEALDRLHCRVARLIIFNLPKDMASHDVSCRVVQYSL